MAPYKIIKRYQIPKAPTQLTFTYIKFWLGVVYIFSMLKVNITRRSFDITGMKLI